MSDTFAIEHDGESYAVDVLAAYGVTRVIEGDHGIEAGPEDLPVDVLDRIADHLAETWATECMARLIEPAERHLARFVVRALLPDPGEGEQDETGLDDLLWVKWAQGRAA